MSEKKIVVGIDGSDESNAALRFALEEARLRGATVEAVHAWGYPPTAFGPGFIAAIDAELIETLHKAAADVIDRALEEAGDVGDLEVAHATPEGPAAPALLEAARDAELLVVGSRGRGGFTGLLLGSVSQQCAHHAPCPVVIVRGPDAATRPAPPKESR
jgi:nucleotide-binding universal stress UspA family protein